MGPASPAQGGPRPARPRPCKFIHQYSSSMSSSPRRPASRSTRKVQPCSPLVQGGCSKSSSSHNNHNQPFPLPHLSSRHTPPAPTSSLSTTVTRAATVNNSTKINTNYAHQPPLPNALNLYSCDDNDPHLSTPTHSRSDLVFVTVLRRCCCRCRTPTSTSIPISTPERNPPFPPDKMLPTR